MKPKLQPDGQRYFRPQAGNYMLGLSRKQGLEDNLFVMRDTFRTLDGSEHDINPKADQVTLRNYRTENKTWSVSGEWKNGENFEFSKTSEKLDRKVTGHIKEGDDGSTSLLELEETLSGGRSYYEKVDRGPNGVLTLEWGSVAE